MNRRTFLKRSVGTLAAAGAGLLGYSYLFETRSARLERREILLAGLSKRLDGFTIGVLADLHVGPLVPADWVRQQAERLAAQKPDLVVVVGDYIGSHASGEAADQALAPVKGALGVIGNWDYYDEYVPRKMRNVKMLINQGQLAADGLWVGGVDEPRLGQPSVAKAMAGAPAGATRILLCHEPDYADTLVKPEHRVALQISGHSHAGQVRLPVIGPLLLPPGGQKYHTGLYAAPHCQVYTSRGLGTAHIPVRLLCPPELTLLTLRAQ